MIKGIANHGRENPKEKRTAVAHHNSLKHKIYVKYGGGELRLSACRDIIKRAVCETLRSEAVDTVCVVNILVTNDKKIRKYNQEYRNIDSATDVLSFPMQEFSHAGWSGCISMETDEDTGFLPLGDIVVSSESVINQAALYGNSTDEEMSYLLIHSTLHLLGYDHADKTNEKLMHSKNKSIMQKTGFKINDK